MRHLTGYNNIFSGNGATVQRMYVVKTFVFFCLFLSLYSKSFSQEVRKDISLNSNWQTIATTDNKLLPANSYAAAINKNWKQVNIPHNWDAYEGYRRLTHGNRHGDSWYRKTFSIQQIKKGKRFFLFFEGVGSYATVYLNGKKVGEHAGGRTTFTIDITAIIKTDGTNNDLAVRAYHPSNIKDLPWVCGGCSDDRGFSEGSQPMGIFRPVHLVITNEVRIAPFGIHAWAAVQKDKASLTIETLVKNYSLRQKNITVTNQLVDAKGTIVKETSNTVSIKEGDAITVQQKDIAITNPFLWSTENPYLYKIVSIVTENNTVIDKTETAFGFRTISWNNPTHQFFLNGKPVFINGVAEYEHLLGQSHAFSNEQIISRMNWLQSAGFNAFRDGHQPHNLLYGQLCAEKGILWWTQLSAHVWYDTKEFRENFKTLLKEWVIERRNDPAIILWGLQNESKLPEDFAKECTDLIRSLDPTASSQRLVTTCNGGSGTDWDVPQNWTGTYGGNPATYADDIKKQILIGEYGAWRTIDLHAEGGFVQNGILSEDRMVQLMEQKIKLGESAKDSSAGHFFWLLTSHDNPGRVQGGEGLREMDRIGPVNYKGLLTPWEEPTDAFYMYRSNYASKETAPMVYIVSHTWPNRWMKPGIKDGIIVYSNCDEVELFNDINNISLGKRKRNGVGTHFQWDNADIKYNVLFAVGYVNGRAMARDTIVLHHLPSSPHYNELYRNAETITKPQSGYNYIYRINCGGSAYIDENKNRWSPDTNFSRSWTNDFKGMPEYFASQRRTFSPIQGTKEWGLFQTFRYGKDKLKYELPLSNGEYIVELYFTEPWLGIGGGMNAKGMRLFDVAINGKTVLDDLDIWSEAGTNTALKKTVKAIIKNGKMVISFPESKAGQAIISAIAVARKGAVSQPAIIKDNKYNAVQYWFDIGDKQYRNENITINSLPSFLYGANWLQFQNRNSKGPSIVKVDKETYLYVAVKKGSDPVPAFENINAAIITDENGGTEYTVYRKKCAAKSVNKITYGSEAIIAWHPVSNMQPAYDLKPVTAYRTNVALIGQGVKKEQLNGRECAIIKEKGKVKIDWPIQTGVADIYSITMKYFYGNEQAAKGKLQLIAPGNTMMLEEEVSFTFTREGKWNQFTINTGNMINAGNYTVRLIIENAEGLAINGIEVQ